MRVLKAIILVMLMGVIAQSSFVFCNSAKSIPKLKIEKKSVTDYQKRKISTTF
jgi:hypothetical protein